MDSIADSELGTGPKAWALTKFPGAMHLVPAPLRTPFCQHSSTPGRGMVAACTRGASGPASLRNKAGPALAAWAAEPCSGFEIRKIELKFDLAADRVIVGTGYDVDVDRLSFLDRGLRSEVARNREGSEVECHLRELGAWSVFHWPGVSDELRAAVSFPSRGTAYTSKIVSRRLCIQDIKEMMISSPVIVLPGAGGGAPDLAPFRAGFPEATQFSILAYPGWRVYVEIGFFAADIDR